MVNVAPMKVAALVLYVVAFGLQMAGAVGVIREVRTSVRNMRQLKVDLTDAEAAADEHRQRIEQFRERPRRFGQQAAEALAAAGEQFVDQTGPAAAVQRRALVKYVTAQNNISDRRRWTAVGLLLGGLVLGFVGNVLSLYPW
jgi:hypothetical protein